MASITKLNTNATLASNAKLYDKFYNRLKGLMFKESFDECDCVILKPCKMIHTFFMNFPIDVVFLDQDFKVIYMIENLKPWRISRYVAKANIVFEFPEGFIWTNSIIIGDILKYQVAN